MPNLNGEKLLAKNLPKVIVAMNNKANSIIEIIIVDDGSWASGNALGLFLLNDYNPKSTFWYFSGFEDGATAPVLTVTYV